ncbi:hypothetical protein Tco_0906738 [Tanacetum coccineum]|uniref:Uncharacterized protein n=1 Tax=Tanacetum coccineum TaxID=301880 RepID=A0ABQ5CJM9_9ASTR
MEIFSPPSYTEPTPFEHIYEGAILSTNILPTQEQAQVKCLWYDLLQAVPMLISELTAWKRGKNRVNGRKSQDDPLNSSVQGLVTPPTTKVNASGEEQVEDISLNTLEAAKTLSKVASLKPSLDFQEEVDAGAEQVNTAKGVNTGSIKLSTVSEQLSTGNEQVSIVGAKKSTSSHVKAKEKEKAPMLSEETPKRVKYKEKILQRKLVDSCQNQRKNNFAEERARAKRNKPMTQSQLKTYMMNYLKNQGTWKLSQLKNLSFEEVKEEFDKLVKQNKKIDEAKDDEPTKKSGKRRKQMARRGLHTNIDKDDSEGSDEVSEQDDSVTVLSMDDLIELYRIVMNRYGMDGPEDELEKVFWKCLKTMFEEPLSTDPIWSELGQQKITKAGDI